MRVRNMTSEKTGRKIANQFIIEDGNAIFFQSYGTIIARKQNDKIQLDREAWDYSVTTGRYRNQFLGESITETRRKIESGEYELANLNR